MYPFLTEETCPHLTRLEICLFTRNGYTFAWLISRLPPPALRARSVSVSLALGHPTLNDFALLRAALARSVWWATLDLYEPSPSYFKRRMRHYESARATIGMLGARPCARPQWDDLPERLQSDRASLNWYNVPGQGGSMSECIESVMLWLTCKPISFGLYCTGKRELWARRGETGPATASSRDAVPEAACDPFCL